MTELIEGMKHQSHLFINSPLVFQAFFTCLLLEDRWLIRLAMGQGAT